MKFSKNSERTTQTVSHSVGSVRLLNKLFEKKQWIDSVYLVDFF